MTTEGAVIRRRAGWLVLAVALLSFVANSCGRGEEAPSVDAAPTTGRVLSTSPIVGVFAGQWESYGGLLTIDDSGAFVLTQRGGSDRTGLTNHHAGNHMTGTVVTEGVQFAFTYVPEEDVVVVSDIGGGNPQTFCGPDAPPLRCGP